MMRGNRNTFVLFSIGLISTLSFLFPKSLPKDPARGIQAIERKPPQVILSFNGLRKLRIMSEFEMRLCRDILNVGLNKLPSYIDIDDQLKNSLEDLTIDGQSFEEIKSWGAMMPKDGNGNHGSQLNLLLTFTLSQKIPDTKHQSIVISTMNRMVYDIAVKQDLLKKLYDAFGKDTGYFSGAQYIDIVVRNGSEDATTTDNQAKMVEEELINQLEKQLPLSTNEENSAANITPEKNNFRSFKSDQTQYRTANEASHVLQSLVDNKSEFKPVQQSVDEYAKIDEVPSQRVSTRHNFAKDSLTSPVPNKEIRDRPSLLSVILVGTGLMVAIVIAFVQYIYGIFFPGPSLLEPVQFSLVQKGVNDHGEDEAVLDHDEIQGNTFTHNTEFPLNTAPSIKFSPRYL